jgi:hypothetical protein
MASHSIYVRLQVSRSAHDTLVVTRIYTNAGQHLSMHNRKTARSWNYFHISGPADREAILGQTGKAQAKQNRFAKPLNVRETLKEANPARALLGQFPSAHREEYRR